jgi:hypothetical protein
MESIWGRSAVFLRLQAGLAASRLICVTRSVEFYLWGANEDLFNGSPYGAHIQVPRLHKKTAVAGAIIGSTFSSGAAL